MSLSLELSDLMTLSLAALLVAPTTARGQSSPADAVAGRRSVRRRTARVGSISTVDVRNIGSGLRQRARLSRRDSRRSRSAVGHRSRHKRRAYAHA